MIKVIDAEAMPTLKRCSLAGHAELKTHNTLFNEHPIAADMLMDILTDRGFATAYDVIEQVVPARVNLQTGEIENRYEYLHPLQVSCTPRCSHTPPALPEWRRTNSHENDFSEEDGSLRAAS